MSAAGAQRAYLLAHPDGAGEYVRSIAADFATGFGRKRITITTAVGHALRFDLQTDFSAGSAQDDGALFARARLSMPVCSEWRRRPMEDVPLSCSF